jgi:glycine/D-amino acid oxidase-like deaminating enzyme
MPSSPYPILVVGQGLAGTWLSYFLLKEGIPFQVLDNYHFQSASMAAAGLINPIVPKRITTTWQFENLFPDFVANNYIDAEKFLNSKLFYPERIIHKIFFHNDDVMAWEAKRKQGLSKVLGEVIFENLNPSMVKHLAFSPIKHSAWVDTPMFIKEFNSFFKRKKLLINEKFDHSILNFEGDYVSYKGSKFSKIIFCEGTLATKNTFFPNLTLRPTKGEELIIRAPELKLNSVASFGIHIIPLDNDLYSVGSTFVWDDLNYQPTSSAKTEIIKRFQKIYKGHFEVINHIAGIRPASVDRRPLVGYHPNHSTIGILNGLGTKGLMLSPFLAKIWLENLVKGKPIPPEMVVGRS